MHEIIDISLRCGTCGAAVRVFVKDTWEDMEGRVAVAYRSEHIPHSRSACDELQLLVQEEWPTLF